MMALVGTTTFALPLLANLVEPGYTMKSGKFASHYHHISGLHVWRQLLGRVRPLICEEEASPLQQIANTRRLNTIALLQGVFEARIPRTKNLAKNMQVQRGNFMATLKKVYKLAHVRDLAEEVIFSMLERIVRS